MLQTLIKARTEQLDDLILNHPSRFEQLLLVGAGLDTRPLRLKTEASWYGVDLEPGLKHRIARYKKNGLEDPMRSVAADLRSEGWLEKLIPQGFDPEKPTLVIIEGVSMYLKPEDLQELAHSLAQKILSPASRIWIDHVTPMVLASKEPYAAEFFATMARMGEPFRTGFDNLASITPDTWALESSPSAADWLKIQDEVHSEYRFSLLRPMSHEQAR